MMGRPSLAPLTGTSVAYLFLLLSLIVTADATTSPRTTHAQPQAGQALVPAQLQLSLSSWPSRRGGSTSFESASGRLQVQDSWTSSRRRRSRGQAMQEPHSTKDLATPRSSLEKRSEATDPQGPSRDAVDSEMAGYRAPAHRSGSTPAQERWARILPEVAHEAEVGRTRWLDYKGPLEKKIEFLRGHRNLWQSLRTVQRETGTVPQLTDSMRRLLQDELNEELVECLFKRTSFEECAPDVSVLEGEQQLVGVLTPEGRAKVQRFVNRNYVRCREVEMLPKHECIKAHTRDLGQQANIYPEVGFWFELPAEIKEVPKALANSVLRPLQPGGARNGGSTPLFFGGSRAGRFIRGP